MARPSKPFFRTQTQSWYCSINGLQYSLGKEKGEAFEKFFELLARKDSAPQSRFSLFDLSQAFLDWCKRNRKLSTYKMHRAMLESFLETLGSRVKVTDIRKHHLTKWLATKDWGPTTQAGAITQIQRMFNWAVEEGHLAASPIPKISKPRCRRREVSCTQELWEEVLSHAEGPLRDLLQFLWLTGCRPQEAKALEARHIHGDMVIFPASEAKGEKYDRAIFLVEHARQIVDRLAAKHRKGAIFRGERGARWSNGTIGTALQRISYKVGFRVIAYGVRHSFATNALLRGIDPVSVAHLMGHRSPVMVARVYSHLAQNHEFLRKQALKAIRRVEVESAEVTATSNAEKQNQP